MCVAALGLDTNTKHEAKTRCAAVLTARLTTPVETLRLCSKRQLAMNIYLSRIISVCTNSRVDPAGGSTPPSIDKTYCPFHRYRCAWDRARVLSHLERGGESERERDSRRCVRLQSSVSDARRFRISERNSHVVIGRAFSWNRGRRRVVVGGRSAKSRGPEDRPPARDQRCCVLWPRDDTHALRFLVPARCANLRYRR